MKTLLISVAVGWVILLMGIFIYGRMHEESTSPPSSSLTEIDSINDAYIGHPILESKPEQIIDLFVQSINAAEYDTALSFLEPNYAAAKIRQYGEYDSVLKLWEPGELKNYALEISPINVSPLPVQLEIRLHSGSVKKFEFTLTELVNKESNPIVKDWYVNSIQLEKTPL